MQTKKIAARKRLFFIAGSYFLRRFRCLGWGGDRFHDLDLGLGFQVLDVIKHFLLRQDVANLVFLLLTASLVYFGWLLHLADAVDAIAHGWQIHAHVSWQLAGVGLHYLRDGGAVDAVQLAARYPLGGAETGRITRGFKGGQFAFAVFLRQFFRFFHGHALTDHGIDFSQWALGRCLELDDTARYQGIGRNFHGFRVALVFQGIVREQGFQEFCIVVRRCAQCRRWRHANVGNGFHFQFQLVGHWLQAVRLGVHQVRELLGKFREFLRGELLAQISGDLAFDFIQRFHVFRLVRGHGQDVVAIVRSNDIADLTLLELGDCVLQWFRQTIVTDHTQVTALFSRSWILRFGFGDSGKLGWRLAHFSQDGISLGLGGCLVGGAGVFLHGDQDVAGTTLFRAGISLLVFCVVTGHVGVADVDLVADRSAVKHGVFDLRVRRDFKLFSVLVVESLDHLVRDLDLRHVLGDRQQQLLHFTLFRGDVRQALADGVRHEGAALYGASQLLKGQVAAAARIVHLRRHALGSQHGLVAFQVEFTVRQSQAWNFQHFILQHGIADDQVAAANFGSHGTFSDQIVEDALARFRRIKHFLVKLLAHHLAVAVDLLALRFFILLLRDDLIADLGDGVRAVAEALVATDTDQCKGRDDDQHQEKLHQASMGTNKFKHGQPIRDEWITIKKGEHAFALISSAEWTGQMSTSPLDSTTWRWNQSRILTPKPLPPDSTMPISL